MTTLAITKTLAAVMQGTALVLLASAGVTAAADDDAPALVKSKPVYVGEPAVPTITPAVRDLPDYVPDPSLFGLETKRREDFGFIPIEYPIKPTVDPLLALEWHSTALLPDGFGTVVHNFAGQSSTTSPPDTTGDVGPGHYVQATNQGVSTVAVLDKSTGAVLKTFQMQSLTGSSPCRFGFSDPIVLYDRAADRWLISELPSAGGNVCVYVSTTGNPTGTWFAYTFAVETSVSDYPKYGVWPQSGNAGSYLLGVNAGPSSSRDIIALDRSKMLAGQPATFQKFSIPSLPNSGFQLVLPSTLQGNTPPPNGEPAVFMRPRDDEAQNGANTPGSDFMDLWTLRVDWATPANSLLTQLAPLAIGDYDMTLCGLGNIFTCMPQPGTSQKIDPIREPLHFPLQYRNFGDHQTLVGTFPEDVDGTDHAAMRWFEIRKTGAGAWTLFQEGLVGGESGVHRSVGSIGMDGSGNIAIGYTRTGDSAPYYPSIYYRGRLASDALGTMPHGEFPIQDGVFAKTGNGRWGDYAGLGVDPSDDCTFWFTTEYMTSNLNVGTRVAAFKFETCGCILPAAPTATASAPLYDRIDVGWGDSSTATVSQYLVFRSTTAGGPYTQIATVSDTSPGVPNGAAYVYHDDTVVGGTVYYYVVQASDGGSCVSANSNEASALATHCTIAPTFAGVTAVASGAVSTCTLNLSWSAGTSNCSAQLSYNVYRSTGSGFVPSPANRIASGVSGNGFIDYFALSGGTTYYYVVRAVDEGSGVEEANLVQQSGVPGGPPTTSSWTDTFEGGLSGGGFDRAGWSHAPIAGATDWAWSTTRKHDGTHSWFAANVGSVSDKVLVSPVFGVGATTTLSFWHTFKFGFSASTCWDGGTLEYTTNGGSTWTVVPAADFTSGGYTGTVSTTRANPIGGLPAWCSGTIGNLTQVTLNLGGDANLVDESVRIRWHEGDDNTTSSTGWYVDTVTINNLLTPGACAPGPACAAPGAPTLTGATGTCAGVSLAWTPGSGSTNAYNVSRSTAPGGPYTRLAGMPVVGTGYTDTTAVVGTTYYYVVTGACDAAGTLESPASNEASGVKKAEGASCSDGNACTQTDSCQAGTCAGGNPVSCAALDQCHLAGVCNTGTGVCSNPAKSNGTTCNDGNACTQTDTCQGGACAGANPVVCTPLDQCHSAGSCDPGTGACSNPAKTDGTACIDGNACTQTDICQSGTCVGTNPVVCTASNQCHDAGVCNVLNGACSNPIKANGTPCNDSNACTQSDSCQAGSCTGANPVICSPLDQCHDAGICNQLTAVCSNPPKADGSACNDGSVCTQPDSCQSGSCTGVPIVVCSALDQCHDAGVCDAGTGICSNPAKPNGSPCSDGEACTANDQCDAGSCTPGTPGSGRASGLVFTGPSDLSWAAVPVATSYDVVRGTLSGLAGGGFSSATDACPGPQVAATSISDAHVPLPGQADWFLVRPTGPCGPGTYDDGSPSQVSSRDPGIAASPNACP